MLSDFFTRQEQVISSRSGAGRTLPESFRLGQWDEQLARDGGIDIEDARRVNRAVYKMLLKVWASGPPGVHTVYETLRATDSAPAGTGPHMVYVCWGTDRLRPLYVGMTSRGPTRLVEHHHQKPWFKEVIRVDFERFEARSRCARREVELIMRYNPHWNVVHNRGR